MSSHASQAEFERLRRRAPHLWGGTTWIISTAAARGTTRLEGLAEEHDRLDGQEENEAGERLLARLGMSEYYGSEGFDHPPSDVYLLVRRRLFRR